MDGPIFGSSISSLMRGPVILSAIQILCLSIAAAVPASEPDMRIRLKDGSFGAGTIVGVEQPNQVGWVSSSFQAPFRFDARALRSVTSIVEQSPEALDKGAGNPAGARQLFELSSGGLVVGRLVSIDNQWLTVDSDILGQVQLTRAAVTAIADAEYAGQVVYSGPIDDERWQRLTEPQDWEFEAGALVATRQGAAIVGNVQLPPQAQINLSMSWRGDPDFVLSLGTSANNKVSKVEEVPSAARLEVWANQLALVREVDGGADIAMLSDLSGTNPRVDLVIYLDQEAGTIMVCDAHGRPLETLKVPSEKSVVRPSIHLANSGPSLTIEHFEVRQWDGVAASVGTGDQSVLDAQGDRRSGAIIGFDADQRELRIVMSDSRELLLPLDQLRRGDFSNPQTMLGENSGTTDEPLPPVVVQPPQIVPQSQSPNAPEQSPTSAINASDSLIAETFDTAAKSTELSENNVELEVVLMDRTRLKGQLLSSEDPQRLRLAAVGLSKDVTFACSAVRGLIGTTDRFVADDGNQVVGTLKTNESQLAGYLDEANNSDSNRDNGTGLVWHPSGSVNASSISAEASGAIVYRKPLPTLTNTLEQQRSQPVGNRARVIPPAVGIFRGNKAVTKSEQANVNGDNEQTSSTPEGREIMFRTGDAIDGIVERIDESGMTFRSSQTSTTVASHELISHVWLNRARGAMETSPEKLKRLMTVPRSMKQDPPTHLFIAVNGDYLRGRLVRLEGDRISVEVRLELVEMSTSQIAQIIWLHDRDWSDKPAKETPTTGEAAAGDTEAVGATAQLEDKRDFLVHAIGRTDRGLTFRPEKFVDGILSGQSDLLGKCSIAVSELNQLLFGRDISQQIRAFRDDPWTLSLAQYPRVYMDDGSSAGGSAGVNSELVGKPATDFLLRSLEGEAFRLSKNRERFVVLDFWASWCGPCIQTMPLVDEVVNEIGVDKIHLVAVNIQETEARARAAVERLEMTATVLLDADGQTAAVYAANAIPQTVIIDRQGIVTHVFVGGGPKFVEQFRQALLSIVEK